MESQFIIKDFSEIKFSSKKITNFLKKNGFYPSDVRDFGEVPGYTKPLWKLAVYYMLIGTIVFIHL